MVSQVAYGTQRDRQHVIGLCSDSSMHVLPCLAKGHICTIDSCLQIFGKWLGSSAVFSNGSFWMLSAINTITITGRGHVRYGSVGQSGTMYTPSPDQLNLKIYWCGEQRVRHAWLVDTALRYRACPRLWSRCIKQKGEIHILLKLAYLFALAWKEPRHVVVYMCVFFLKSTAAVALTSGPQYSWQTWRHGRLIHSSPCKPSLALGALAVPVCCAVVLC